MTNKGEDIYEDSKIRGSTHRVGYKKTVASCVFAVLGLLVLYTNPSVPGWKIWFALAAALFIWATLEKKAHKRKVERVSLKELERQAVEGTKESGGE